MRWIGLIVVWLFGFEVLGSLRESHSYLAVIIVFLVLIAITIVVCSTPKNTNQINK